MKLFKATALITGASGAIGEAIARAFAAEGANLVLTSRSPDKLNRIAQSIGEHRVLTVSADITKPLEVELIVKKAQEKFKNIDILVNNAAVGLTSDIMNISTEDFMYVFNVNFMGPLYIIQKTVPIMKQNDGGIIINVSSMITRIATKGSGGYRATKMALDSLTDAIRLELRDEKIKVITMYPGLTKSNFFRNSLGSNKLSSANNNHNFNYTPEQVAKRIIFAVHKEPRTVFMSLRGQIGGLAAQLFPGILENFLYLRKKYL